MTGWLTGVTICCVPRKGPMPGLQAVEHLGTRPEVHSPGKEGPLGLGVNGVKGEGKLRGLCWPFRRGCAVYCTGCSV